MSAKSAWKAYRRLEKLTAENLELVEAGLRRLLCDSLPDKKLAALCHNDLGVLLAAKGEKAAAKAEFTASLQACPECAAAQENLLRLGLTEPVKSLKQSSLPSSQKPKIAILSLLFNWPSSGGGVMNTVGTGKALLQAGYQVKHFYADYPAFGVGRMEAPYPLEKEALCFDRAAWQCEMVKTRFREAVERFQPDMVLITDAWNFKPHLAEAMNGYRVVLRFDGQECLCPLNNCRFLNGPEGTFSQCPYHQLATPDLCQHCLLTRGQWGGPLHRGERELSEVSSPQYQELLRKTLWEAAALLVNNPLIEALLSPYAKQVAVIPPGVDLARFPWRDNGSPEESAERPPAKIFMAGVIEEPFKGFSILHSACGELWEKRQDFQLLVTAAQPGAIDPFTTSTGWLSQEALPEYYRAADICVVPSIVQESWGTVAIEAMAAGRPVIASRIGGLQFLVGDGGSGLLFAPGDGEGLAHGLALLLDNPELRRQMGHNARRRIEQNGSWEALMNQCYQPLLANLLRDGK